MFDHIAESCDSHGHHFGHGGCHGTAVHDWHKDGVTVSEFGAGESQEAPFTMLDETIRFRDGAACLEFTAGVKRIDWLKAEAKSHGKEWKHGHCANKPVHCEESHGFHICAAHAGVDVSDIIDLVSIHITVNGVCHSASGNKKDVQHARDQAESHGMTVKDGKCKVNIDCNTWKGLKVCQSGAADAWDGGNTVHGMQGANCLQFRGAVVKTAKWDNMIAKAGKAHHVVIEEGPCPKGPNSKEIHHGHHGGVDISMWN